MKKFLTVLSLSTILTTSFAVVSCKKPNNKVKVEEKNKENSKNDISDEKRESTETVPILILIKILSMD
ncbi:putative lipoprotein [Mycoplasma leachii PG50]|uniref:Putative lipoprotein n=1 Tax=Mycoplasma leachii (strain DSM 21131 / NCTC 10133 / N29 / PG50) TaxID=880447 RepID=E4PUF0_MYCLG|nr:hypothetical protein [Mycoplasma leachii]ADR24263.1 putative lipoprotein [Mycoplasma leachii PG50]CBV67077.1 Lipoprotein, putative [Mycoplasma leachii 99/014/6]